MTLPLESLKLTPTTLDLADSKAGALAEEATGDFMLLANIGLIMCALILIILLIGTFTASKKSSVPLSALLAVIIVGLILINVMPKTSYEYKADLFIENISMKADAADVTFKNNDALYTSTLTKENAETLSGCKNITASRFSYKKLDNPALGDFTIDEKDEGCILNGK